MDRKKFRTHNLVEKVILYFLKALIIAAFSGSIYYCWVEFYNPEIPTPFYRLGNYFMGAIIVAFYTSFVKVYGGFLVGTSTVIDLIFSQIISIGFLQGFCYVIFSLLSYRLLSVWPFVLMFVVFSVIAAVWCFVADFVYFKIHKPKRTIFVYGNVDSYHSLKGINRITKRFEVRKTVNCDETSLEELFAMTDHIDAIFLCGVPSDYRNEVVKFCMANGKVAYIKPKISDTIIRGGRTIQLLNVPVYRCRRSDQSLLYLFLKRAADIVLSLIALVISSPFMLATAIAIKAYDGGDIFYKQVRLTTNGKKFELIKFRSMIQNAEKDGVARLASEGDSRITPVGHFIRKTRLDELPQLINILKGDMSFVGPRPERPEIAAQYEEERPEFALRLQVKAGLTGYAQVYGKYNTPPYDKVQMDLMYIANQSLLEDLRLMLMTFKILFVPSSTEGVGEEQTTAQRSPTDTEE
ncbi:MAG: exopolysaccharide biosynthesis polyprenyl glycosylphosphotransferase [Clostridia bacterium]|nr:exopolysaccharide biosynthesis polyprenyl glycosylphosphotransferase [Clostridia bacterium]